MKSQATLKPNRSDVIYYCLLAVVAFAFVFICSASTSPLYVDGDLAADANDACQFMTIGHEWLYGKIPYRDIFDHKGPYIFFVNMLGFAITGARSGVFIIQVINMFAILCGLDAIARLQSLSKRYRILVVIVTLLVMRPTYASGDRTEEFCLPFIVWATYFQLRYLLLAKSPQCIPAGEAQEADGVNVAGRSAESQYVSKGMTNDHRPIFTLLYGVAFGICLMTRATNFVTVGVGALCVAVVLLQGRRIKCFLLNVLAFAGGTALIVVPFSLYFAAMGCFDDYFFATITFNVLYSGAFAPWILSSDIAGVVSYLVRTVPFSCALVAGIIFLAQKRWRPAIYCMACWCLEAYLFFSSAPFTVYAAVTTAQCVILFNAAYGLDSKWGKYAKVCICVALMLYAAFEVAVIVRGSHKILTEENPDMVPAKEYIEAIPEDDRQSIMLLGDMWAKPLYLRYGIHPQYKYYNLQEWHGNFSDKVYDEVQEQFANGDAKYIIADGTKYIVDDILADRYQLVGENEGIHLYELKDSE